jgi:Bifunctional DNA primase/polymerase, N-terminal
VDTRGAGGLVVAPGSVIDGKSYELISGELKSVPPPPAWLVQLLRAVEPAGPAAPVTPWFQVQAVDELGRRSRLLATAIPGTWNPALNTEAWVLRRAVPALGVEAVTDALFAARLMNGLVDEDGENAVRATIRSGLGC